MAGPRNEPPVGEKHLKASEGVARDAASPRSSDPENFSGDPKLQHLAQEVSYADEEDPVNRQHNPLAQKLRSRHMQMIAIGEWLPFAVVLPVGC